MALKRSRRQCAALPFSWRADGACIVLLVTSRETRRWVLPKGWVARKVKAAQQAAREAFEEAGVIGEVAKRALGHYRYEKRLRDGQIVLCRVDVFPMSVSGRLDAWPERAEREVAWFRPDEAAALVDESGLAEILRGFEEWLVRPTVSPGPALLPSG